VHDNTHDRIGVKLSAQSSLLARYLVCNCHGSACV